MKDVLVERRESDVDMSDEDPLRSLRITERLAASSEEPADDDDDNNIERDEDEH